MYVLVHSRLLIIRKKRSVTLNLDDKVKQVNVMRCVLYKQTFFLVCTSLILFEAHNQC
jgi:hypothetical protein